MQSAGDWIRHGVKFGAGLHGWGWGSGCRGPAAETAWGWLSLPQQALETALVSQPREAPPLLGPSVSPTFSGKAGASSAPIHRAPVPSASRQQPCCLGEASPHKSLGPAQLSLHHFLRLFFVSFSGLPPFLCPSCTVWIIQQDSTPSGFVQEPDSTHVLLFFGDLEVLINILEDFLIF